MIVSNLKYFLVYFQISAIKQFHFSFTVHQIAGSIYTKDEIEAELIVGNTKGHVQQWAQSAYNKGKRFVANPTMRTNACYCVINAIKAGIKLDKSKAFSFKIYARTFLLAEKVKGRVRNITDCLHKGEAVDDTNALVTVEKYIEEKLFDAMEHMPPLRQQSVLQYLRNHGWDIEVMD